ncbi:hypothetical protein [Clostridium botulinum]|uniref:Uncharacterized protein n=1 Tax=Clostridium botulinum TaxID=1491 RepID=A0A846HWG1_CLOBO|nr:hypothetical protein [Clostridium botulinum]AJE10780.1 hypothetical protein T259_2069 [Clostridium botulinum CDC_1436]AJE11452.1 hypothetical protein T259_1794 [Clostridium botulinum CDC_1436]KGO13528.1 hypothetical protein NZ45_11780 [Clostridium botulinum]MBY6877518.1 hypothetical protein [Clostridium botulinum]MCC5422462.1 hypothetical protein [Clostridium botulinum]
MWCDYTKTFVFRDCFDEEKIAGNVSAINELLNKKQINGDTGCFVVTDVLHVGTLIDRVEAYKNEDDGSWNLCFLNKNKEIANVAIWDYKEVHLCFEIEEKIDTRELSIHYCAVKAFKEYQIQ